MRILLIDDSLSDQGEVASVLLAAGHEVVVASSTREAIQAITEDCVHLVLVDATIPRFSDLHFLELLREDLKWLDLPAIVLADEEGLSRLASLSHLRLSLCVAKTASVIAQLPALIREAIKSETGQG